MLYYILHTYFWPNLYINARGLFIVVSADKIVVFITLMPILYLQSPTCVKGQIERR